MDKPYRFPKTLKKKHEDIKTASLEEFRSKRKLGSSQFSQTYEDELIRKIENAYTSFAKRNKDKYSKYLLHTYGPPVVGAVGAAAGAAVIVASRLAWALL